MSEGIQELINMMDEEILICGMTIEEIQEIRMWKIEFETKGLKISNISDAYKKGYEDCKKIIEDNLQRQFQSMREVE